MKKSSIIITILVIILAALCLIYFPAARTQQSAPEMNTPAPSDALPVGNTQPTPIVVENFEGEADPSVMRLNMKDWNWISTTSADGAVTSPKTEKQFTLTFKNDNSFSARTDCNGIGGSYQAKGDTIAFTDMMSTLMFCEGSQENEFSKNLSEAERYHFTSKGELVLILQSGSGEMVFR